MDKKELLERLTTWEENLKNLVKLDEDIYRTFGCRDSIEDIFILADEYTDLLESDLGIGNGLLSWYAWENDFGMKFGSGIHCLEDLVDYIIAG